MASSGDGETSIKKLRSDDAMAEAVHAFLEACGVDMTHRDFQGSPRRVAKLWQEQFLSGYDMDPARILGDPVYGEEGTELVVVKDIPCHGMCPHHLMPWSGVATVAYLPEEALLGFGRLAELVHCFTRRLTLQERACNDIAGALMEHLGARGSACVLSGSHSCLNVPGDKHGTKVLTSTYLGEFKTRPDLQNQLLSR